ncbi:MAG: hypothetical protein MMC33_008985 [Icmadophila ericetorum]|nr:hypothetical protein [Icmadophila ericetorum]
MAEGVADSNFEIIWREAFRTYKEKTKRDLNSKSVIVELQNLHTIDDLNQKIGERYGSFEAFRNKHGALAARVQTCMKPVETLSGVISSAIAMTPYAPACAIFGAGMFLINSAQSQSAAYDWIEALFQILEEFAIRLEYYTKGDMVTHLQRKVTGILTFMLDIFATAEKTVRQGRFKNYLAVTFLNQDADVKGALDKLNALLETEEKLVIAVMFADVQETKKTVGRVEQTTERTEKSIGKVDQTTERTEKIVVRVDKTIERLEKSSEIHQKTLESFVKDEKRYQKDLANRELIKKALELPVLAKVLATQDTLIQGTEEGTTKWVTKDKDFRQWERSKTKMLLLIGNEGAGKSYVTSNIIVHLSHKFPQDPNHPSQVSIGFFYFKSDDPQLLSIENMLKTVAYQISTNDSVYRNHVLNQCERTKPENGVQGIWENFFVKFFGPSESQSHDSSAYIVLDGLDRVPKEDRNNLLKLFKKFEDLHDETTSSRLRIAIVGRPIIREDDDSPYSYSHYIDVSQRNIDDLSRYISNKVKTRVQIIQPGRGSLPKAEKETLRSYIISALTEGASGTFTWVNLMLDQIAKKTRKSQIHTILENAPKGLDGAIHHVLEDLARDPDIEVDDLNELLRWVTTGRRSLALGELFVILILAHEDHEPNDLLEERLRGRFSSFFRLDRSDGLTTELLQERARQVLRHETEQHKEMDDEQYDELLNQANVPSFKSDMLTTNVSFKDEGIRDFLIRKGHPPVGKNEDSPGIGFETQEAEVQITMTCLRVLQNRKHLEEFRKTNLAGYAAAFAIDHLSAVDRSKASAESKSTISGLLSKLFSREEALATWTEVLSLINGWWYFREVLLSDKKIIKAILGWFKDVESLDDIDSEDIAFMRDASKSLKDLLKPFATYCSQIWLTKKGYDIDKHIFIDPEDYVIFLHYYHGLNDKDDDDKNESEETEEKQQVGLVDLSEERIKELSDLADVEKSAVWYARLAKILRDAGHTDPAIPLFTKALEISSNQWGAWEGLAWCYANQEEWQKAIDSLQEAITRFSGEKDQEKAKEDEADALTWMSPWYVKLGKIDEAVNVAEKAYLLDPDNTEVQYGVINALNAAERWDRLMDFLETLKKTFPKPSKEEKEEEGEEESDAAIKQTSLARLIVNPPQYDLNDMIISAAKKASKVDLIADAIKETIANAKQQKDDLQAAIQRYKLADLYLDQAEDDLQKTYEGIAAFEQLLAEGTLAKLDESEEYVWNVQWITKRRLARLYFLEAIAAKEKGTPYGNYLSGLQVLAGEGKDPDDEDVYSVGSAACMLGLWYRQDGQIEKAKACLRAQALQTIQILQDDDPSNDMRGWIDLGAALNYAGDAKNAAAAYMVTVNALDKMKENKRSSQEAEAKAKAEAEKESKGGEPHKDVMPIAEVKDALATGDLEKLGNVAPVVVAVPADPDHPEENIKPTRPPLDASDVLAITITAANEGKQNSEVEISEPAAVASEDPLTVNWSCDGGCYEERQDVDWNELWFCQNCFDICFCDKCFAILQSGEKRFMKCSSSHKFIQAYPIKPEVLDVCCTKENGVVLPKQEWLEALKKEWEEPKKE